MPCHATAQPGSRAAESHPCSHKTALVWCCSWTLNPALPIETIVSLVAQVFDKEGIKHVRIAPGDSAVDREVAAHSFKTDPTVQIFLLHAGQAAAGLTLTECREGLYV